LGNTTEENSTKLLRLQKRAARLVYDDFDTKYLGS